MVEQFLQKHNQSTNNIDVTKMVALAMDEMKQGLTRFDGTIPMIPTYLQNIDRDKIKSGKRLLIDAGGTNFRSAIGYFDENGDVKIERLQKTKMPASDQYLNKQQFYDAIANNVRNLLDDCTDVGFCFSYQVDMQPNMDGKVVLFSKEVKAPEVIGTFVGAETLSAIKQFSATNRKIVILNDTVATLLGGMAISQKRYSAYVGYIFGTGTNLCYIEDTKNITKVQGLPAGKMLINTEMGGTTCFAQGDFDKIVADATANPTVQLFEKMSSGRYLADIIYQAFKFGATEGIFDSQIDLCPFELKDVSAFLEGATNVVYNVFHSDTDRATAREICLNLIDRSAKMGAILNATAVLMSCNDKSLPVAIVAEGTTFNKLPTFKDNFKKYLNEILAPNGIAFDIVQGEELNLIGTLMATMAL